MRSSCSSTFFVAMPINWDYPDVRPGTLNYVGYALVHYEIVEIR